MFFYFNFKFDLTLPLKKWTKISENIFFKVFFVCVLGGHFWGFKPQGLSACLLHQSTICEEKNMTSIKKMSENDTLRDFIFLFF